MRAICVKVADMFTKPPNLSIADTVNWFLWPTVNEHQVFLLPLLSKLDFTS